jgi:hypothetical protein
MRTRRQRPRWTAGSATVHHRTHGHAGRGRRPNTCTADLNPEGRTQVVKVFELAVARTGLRDAEAAAAGLDPVTVGSVEFDHKAYTLAETEELLELSEHRRGTNELHQRAQAKVAEIDAKIDQLTQMRQMLVAVMAAECDSLTDCTCGLGCPLPELEITGPGGANGDHD